MIGANDEVVMKNADPYEVTKTVLVGSNVIRKPSMRVKPLVTKKQQSMLTVSVQSKGTSNSNMDSFQSYFMPAEDSGL